MKLDEKQVVENWNELIRVVNATFTGERKEKINKLLEHFSERMSLAPASAKEYYHCAYPGGYVEHVLHVITGAKLLKDAWKKMGCDINFTDEELVFSALFHDLGKVGDMTEDTYIPQEDQWRRNKLGEIYTFSDKLDFMQVTDRTFFLLSQFGITYSPAEFLAIRLADGLYAEYNKSYLITYNQNQIMKSNLAYILHAADFMAMHSEYDAWKKSEVEELQPEKVKAKYAKKPTLAEIAKATLPNNSKLLDFDNLF